MALPSLQPTGPQAWDAYEKSKELVSWLQGGNIAIGFTDERGPAWWAKDQENPLADGTHFPGAVPLDEVQRILATKLVEQPIYLKRDDGTFYEVTDNKAIRLETNEQPMNLPSQGYTPHQYLENLHTFIQRIVGEAEVGSVGRLQKGAVAFIQAVLPETREVAGYGFQPYITGATSGNSTLATTYLTGGKGVVCDNTLDMAVKGALTKFKIKHTKHSGVSVQAAREKLGIQLVQVADDMTETIENLLKIDVTERDFELWLDEIAPMPEAQDNGYRKDGKPASPGRSYTMTEAQRDKYTQLWRKDEKVAPWSGTGFGIWQLSNTYDTWERIVRSADGGRLERNYLNSVSGSVAKSDRKALDALATVQERRLVVA